MQNRDNSQFRVLLTGASGYLAGHIQNIILVRGYKIRGTVRSLKNHKKIDHIYQTNPALKQNLELVEADLCSKECWNSIMKDVDFVIHTASPFPQKIPKDEDELIKPEVLGTEAIFESALRNGANCHAYEKSQNLGEKKAWEIFEKNKQKIQLIVILPGFIKGPSYHTNDYTSADFILKTMKNELPGIPKVSMAIVDVRDCALAHMIALNQEKLEAKNGKRYILIEDSYWMYDLIQILKDEFAQYNYKFPSFTVESKFLLSLAGCIDKQVEMIKPNFQRRAVFDNTPAMKELGIIFRGHRNTIVKFAYDLINKGCIPNKLPKNVQVSPILEKN
ncbi:hypothetical protein ABPG72_010809 [Tetrahymena utriculariae]